MNRLIKSKVVGPDDDLYTMEQFKGCAECGALIDYDGFGKLSDGTDVSDIRISPSQVLNPLYMSELPSWATHVVWYNR